MDKYIGFDIDTAKTAVCVIQKGQKERFYTLGSDLRNLFQINILPNVPGGIRTCSLWLRRTYCSS